MEQKVAELFGKGYTIGMVVEATGLSKYKIVKIKKELGLVKKKPTENIEKIEVVKKPSEMSFEEKEKVKALYMDGRGTQKIAKELSLSSRKVAEFCKTLNRPKRGEDGYVYKGKKFPKSDLSDIDEKRD